MSQNADFGGPIVWEPNPADIEKARLTDFMRLHQLKDFDHLMQRSTEDVAWFTDAIFKYLEIEFYKPYSEVLDLSDGIAFPKWCVGAEMNIVHNCLDKYIGTEMESNTALIFEAEDGSSKEISYKDLYVQVNQATNALRQLGLGKGDIIGIFMPMIPEIVVALLAIAKIGAIILPLFSGYGVDALRSRLADANAKALFTADGFPRRGKIIEMKSVADQAAEQLPGLQHMIVFNHADLQIEMQTHRDHWWHEIVTPQASSAPTEKTSAEDTLMLIYTSGTTGKPKGAVHTHAGFPVKAAQDMAFSTDIHSEDIIYWMTDMGWMMGPWLVFGALILGASFLIFDGAPDFPKPDRLWQMAARHKIMVLGLSPTLIRALMPHGHEIVQQHDLSHVRCFASTGEPWNPGPWMWLFETIGKSKKPIINFSGGTEISGGILSGNPILPLKATAFSGPCPGISADIFNEEGQSVSNEVGELVIKAPWIGMTRGFWQSKQRYLESYWSRWPDIWVHGDWAAKDSDGLWYILGRSDDTIKIAGKRLGPAEVESLLVAHPSILEAAAIGIPDKIKGSALVVLCVLVDGRSPDETLRKELKDSLVIGMGKALAPKEILFVSDLPKTRNAKVMRRMLRSAYLGEDPGDTSSLVNPEAVEEIRKASLNNAL